MPAAGGRVCASEGAATATDRARPRHAAREARRKRKEITADTGVKTPGSGSWLCRGHSPQQLASLLLDSLERLLHLDDVALPGELELPPELGDP